MFSHPFRPASSQPAQQQQARRPADRQQQQSGTTPEFQQRQQQMQGADTTDKADKADKPPQQMGEGSYEATRDYQESIKTYLDKADVKSDAQAAKPASPQEAEALKKAEEEGLSHSKAPGQ